ncbi:hypothetical protein, partial [Stenotrophomonas muris]|uniref:hypothetical protein n=1 Tax=Stenotrophomonas muris TaxID=2963283 RepID=UPI0039C5ED1C
MKDILVVGNFSPISGLVYAPFEKNRKPCGHVSSRAQGWDGPVKELTVSSTRRRNGLAQLSGWRL